MNKNASVLDGKPLRRLAAMAACVLVWGSAHAESRPVTIKISINTTGLDLNRPADAREVYRRLYLAARAACGDAKRVGLESPPNFMACYEQALAGAIRSVNRPQLNFVYLATHTGRDAERYGIEVPPRMAAK